MSLTLGARLGPYEILSPLGAGGMGEVYRARDTKLDRDVAIKVLPEAFAADPERIARLQREAKTLASLNHPNIAIIHGLEQAGDTQALVMELVEGDDLSQRLARGPIPLDEALSIARQICEALEAAHDLGIIHRDLKPANIKVTPAGVVKVLDFGLAKLTEASTETGSRPAALSMSPTITSPAMMTGAGMILGTAAYMAPEQAKGRPADKRSDIWAFGCVLYEMLTGRRPFDGEDITDVLGAVVRLEPDWTALPSNVPSPVRTLLQRCLMKERRTRIADIAAARFILDHHAGMIVGTAPAAVPRASLSRRLTSMAAAAGTGALLAGAGIWWLTPPEPRSLVVMRITTSGPTALVSSGADRDLAITPDGSRIVYRGAGRLLVRALNDLQPTVLSGLGAPHGVFVSPDGQWVGFFDGLSRLARVSITGGSPVPIGPIDGGGPRGATWGPDGNIIFATNLSATGLQRVSAAGGEPVVLTRPDRARGEGDHLWPEFLPGGKAVLFTITQPGGGIENAQIAVLDLVTGTWKVLLRGGSHAHFVPTGHLVYGVAGTLRAVAFDLGRLELAGTPTPVLEGVMTTAQGAADVAIAANGSLVYVPGDADVGGRRVVMMVNRQGRASPLPNLPLDAYRDVQVSPHGTLLALATQDDLLIYDLTRATRSRLTTDAAPDRSPLWTPDGKRIVYTSLRAGYPQLFWRPADPTGTDELLLARSKNLLSLRATGWSADGSHLLFTEVKADIQSAIGQIAIKRPSDVTVLVENAFYNDSAVVSPNGQWMAYQSSVSGQQEIYIERYPELGNRETISTAGGTRPFWSVDGGELFFGSLDNRQMMAVTVKSGPVLVIGTPHVLFEFPMLPIVGGPRPYDITPDGRFVIIQSDHTDGADGPASSMLFVQHWDEELKRLVPIK